MSYNASLQAKNAKLQALINKANSLPEQNEGVELPTLSNPGSATDALSGKEFIDQEGNIVTGTIPSQAAKTITPTKSQQTAVASGVYTTGEIKVAAIPNEYITTTDATASADEIFNGETAYVGGSKVTGTFTLESEITEQNGLIAQLQNMVDELPVRGSSFPYRVTITQSGYTTCSPIIYYGENNDKLIVVTDANKAGLLSCTWTYSNCNLAYSNIEIGGGADGYGLGNFACFDNFTGDATINIHWEKSFNSGQ